MSRLCACCEKTKAEVRIEAINPPVCRSCAATFYPNSEVVETLKSDKQIVNEGGINWCWFTEFTVNGDGTVTIHRHYRLHKYQGGENRWSKEQLDAPEHQGYYHEQIWKEDDKRVATEYFVPGQGWMKISNPSYIFGY